MMRLLLFLKEGGVGLRRRYNIDVAKKIFRDSGCVLLASEYSSCDTKMPYICSCGNTSEITLYAFMKGARCSSCRGNKISASKSYSYEFVRDTFAQEGCELLSSEYRNNRTKLDYICSCGRKSKITFGMFLQGQRCSVCRSAKISEALKTPFHIVKSDFEKAGFILLETKYMDNKTPMRFICSCGRRAKITYERVKLGSKCRGCLGERMRGPNSPSWNPQLSDEERFANRDFLEYRIWRQAVYERDGYTCQHCLVRGGTLNAHHIESYNAVKELRTDIGNGVTLCIKCHRDFHARYGYGNNTRKQFDEWQKSAVPLVVEKGAA